MTGRPQTERRWPIDPLLETRTRAELEKATGAAWRTVRRAAEEGLTDEQAYSWCDALGLHPWLVWPGLSAFAIDEVTRVCAADDCTESFVPEKSTRRYCSFQCYQRVWARTRRDKAALNAKKRERYRTDPEYRERRKAEVAERRAFLKARGVA